MLSNRTGSYFFFLDPALSKQDYVNGPAKLLCHFSPPTSKGRGHTPQCSSHGSKNQPFRGFQVTQESKTMSTLQNLPVFPILMNEIANISDTDAITTG